MVARLPIQAPRVVIRGPIFERYHRPLQEGRWSDIPREALIEGGTGTGKSFGLGDFVRRDMRRFPGVHWLVIRRFKADLPGSWMQTWEEEVLDPNDPWDRYMLRGPSRRNRTEYSYPNGSVLWVRGMNQWARVKSMAFDRIWGVEATELQEDHAEGLSTRVRARKGVDVPFRCLMWDVNPGPPQHWLNQRALRGVCERLTTRIWHNPGYWDARTNEPTPNGAEYIERMLSGSLRGHNLRRLWHCEWAAASGLILDTFSAETHMFDGRVLRRDGALDMLVVGPGHKVLPESIEIGWYLASVDWGRRHAGTLQVWAVDTLGRMFLVEEWYHSEWSIFRWAEIAADVARRYRAGNRGVALQAIVCDNAIPDHIDQLNKAIFDRTKNAAACIAVPCKKASAHDDWSNLEVLRSAFEGQNGVPDIYIGRNVRQHAPDMELTERCLADEIPGWVYAEYDPDKASQRPRDEPDERCTDDGLDAATYARVFIMGQRRNYTPSSGRYTSWNPRRAELVAGQLGLKVLPT